MKRQRRERDRGKERDSERSRKGRKGREGRREEGLQREREREQIATNPRITAPHMTDPRGL